MKKYIFLSYLFVSSLMLLSGQDWSTIKTKSIIIQTTIYKIDSLSIVPSSIQVLKNNSPIDTSLYSTDPLKSEITFSSVLLNDTVEISFRVYPFTLYKEYSNRKYTDALRLKMHPYEFSANFSQKKKLIFKEGDIISNGNISRGLSFGNNQDLVVKSELNLKLQGQLNDKLKINALITDNNIPIQADGYTQQIQDFDKIFVEIYNDQLSLTVGDVLLENKESKYLQLQKKVQGLKFKSLFEDKKKKFSYKMTAAAAVAKGKYNRNTFTGIEGNQGPYLLSGSQGERYIVILSGSEKVYIDGQLLTRGEEGDYIIDYNRAEIIFTNQQAITKDKRISIEFEYSERNYTRFVTYSNNEFTSKNSKLWLNFYGEKDAKNQTISYDLSQLDKTILLNSGDRIDQAFSQRIDSVAFSNTEVLYAKIDSLHFGTNYTIYQYSTSLDSAFYRLSFTYFGENKGNYILINQLANGRVFKWVAPENGIPQGQYEPVVLIASPKSQQIINIGAEQRMKSTTIRTDFSLSNKDLNLYSHLDDNDNVGYAGDFTISHSKFLKNKKYKINANVNYQLINSNFTSPERFRSVEFDRDWNLSQKDTTKNEHISSAYIEIADTNQNFIKSSLESYFISDFFMGNKAIVQSSFTNEDWLFNFDGSYLKTNDDFQHTDFFRNKFNTAKKGENITIGIRQQSEYNRWQDAIVDTLISSSKAFYEAGAYMNFKDSSNRQFNIEYTYRQDFLPDKDAFFLHNSSHNAKGQLQIHQGKNQQIALGVNYRNLTYFKPVNEYEQNENTFLAKINYHLNFLNKGIRMNTIYEIGSGMEARKEYFYLEVNPGQGVYTWVDYNENSIQELDEFQIAEYQDEANYIRVTQVSKELEKVLNNNLNFTFYIKPSQFIKEKKGIKGFIRNFSDKLIIKTTNKNYPDFFIENLNPFILLNPKAQTLNNDYLLRNSFSWNSANRKFFLDYIFSDNRSKILLVNGIDKQSYLNNEFKLRYKVNQSIQFSNTILIGNKEFDSDYLVSKNYNLQVHSNKFSSHFQSGMKWNVKTSYMIQQKENTIGDEFLLSHKVENILFFTLGKKGKISSNLAYVYNRFNSESNSAISYEIMEGLQNGHNGILGFSFFKQISKYMELNINYSGRISEMGKPIHNASMQLKAVF